MADSIKIIIDTDPGVDDAIAILMALASPNVEVLGLTSVGGNVSLAWATRNSLALLEYAQKSEIPVAKGAARPRRGRFPYAHYFHGETGLTYRLPRPLIRPVRTGAVDFLARQLGQHPGQTTLVALGPLTNLARLERRYPGSLAKARSLLAMGGAVNVPGNVTPHAEFNFYSDPVAAAEVLSAGVPLTLVDLGACRQVSISREAAENLQCSQPLGNLAVQLLQSWFQQDDTRERFEFYDPLTLAAAVDPEILITHQATVSVDTSDSPSLGESRVTADSGTTSVVDRADSRRFFDLLNGLLGLESRP